MAAPPLDPIPNRDPFLADYYELARQDRALERRSGIWRDRDGRIRQVGQWGSLSHENRLLSNEHRWAPTQTHAGGRHHAAVQQTAAGQGLAPVHGGFSAYRQQTGHSDPNLSVGPLDLAFTWKTILESTDNYFHHPSDEADALSLTMGMMVDGVWQISEGQAIDLRLGMGADYWIDGPGDGRESGDLLLNVIPSSQINYLIHIGETVQIRLYDRLEIRRDLGRSLYSLDAVDVADRWSNAGGARISWLMNERVSIELGYEMGTQEAFDSAFTRIDHHWNTTSARIGYIDDASYHFGIEATASAIDYDAHSRNDGDNFGVGLFATWAVSDYTSISANLGFEEWEFDRSTTAPAFDHQGLYGSLGISNQLNETFGHTLTWARQSQLSDFSNIVESHYIRYGIDWDADSRLRLSGYLSYGRSDERGNARRESLDYMQANLAAQQSLTDYLSLGIGGTYGDTNSNLVNRSYSSVRGQTWLSWQLNEHSSFTASYEYWQIRGDRQAKENRLRLGASLSF